MLQGKDIKKLSELKNGFTHRWFEPDFLFRTMKVFSFSAFCKTLSHLKEKGYSFEWIMSILITMSFNGVKTVNGLPGLFKAGNDVFYRLKNSTSISWRSILWLFNRKVHKILKEKSENSGLRCLIFDDTVIQKTGKFIEKVSKVWDHVQGCCVIGYKLLVMGYWDGTTFLPLDCSVHREKGKNQEKPYGLRKKDLRRQFKKRRYPGTKTYERAQEADESKISSMIKMFGRAISDGLQIDYVLTDSWFTCEALITAVTNVKSQVIHVIGMYKNVKEKFLFNEKLQTYNQIRNCLGKARRCRKINLYYLQAHVMLGGKKIQIFFSKHGKNGKWKVIVTTDTTISFIRLIEIYQIRWTIEVFFKESKQMFGLGKCQSNDFDAQIADFTISLIQYILVSLRYRFDTYESKGKLFDQIKDEVIVYKLNERLWGLFVELLQILATVFEDIDEIALWQKILNNDEIMNRIMAMLYPNGIENEILEAA
jgi:hypothetical protein